MEEHNDLLHFELGQFHSFLGVLIFHFRIVSRDDDASLPTGSDARPHLSIHGWDHRVLNNTIDDDSFFLNFNRCAAMPLPQTPALIFTALLPLAVLLRHARWKEIVLISSIGSSTGGLILYFTFYYLGWSQIAAAYPDLMPIETMVRRDTLGLGLRLLGAARHRLAGQNPRLDDC
jgi:hypothetical protein